MVKETQQAMELGERASRQSYGFCWMTATWWPHRVEGRSPSAVPSRLLALHINQTQPETENLGDAGCLEWGAEYS